MSTTGTSALYRLILLTLTRRVICVPLLALALSRLSLEVHCRNVVLARRRPQAAWHCPWGK